MGVGEAGIGMCVMHDGAHGSFSKYAWVNRLATGTILLLGSGESNWRMQHNLLHHSFTNVYGYDQDIETKAVIRLSDHSPLKPYHRFQFFYAFFFYGLMTLSKLITDFTQLKDFNREGITKQYGLKPGREILKLIVLKLLYITIILGIPWVFTGYSWWQLLIGFCCMHITAGMIMSTIFQMAHVVQGAAQPLPDENGIISTDFMVHQLLTTSDFARQNSLVNWYAGGLNFQIEHHLFPHISHIHYRDIAPIVEKTAKEYGFYYNLKDTFWAAFRSHVLRLRALGKAPSV
jgi:linoleoyl-CoA desaturase